MSDQIIHTPECEKAHARYQALKNQYEQQWPNHCLECGGNGGVTDSYDPSPHGVGLASGRMYDFEPCCHCVGRGICPRCGMESLDEDGNICATCGWEECRVGSEGLPEAPDCDCWEDTIARDLEAILDLRFDMEQDDRERTEEEKPSLMDGWEDR